MKKFIIVNDGNCFFVEANDVKEVYALTERPHINHSKPINVHEIKAVYGNVWSIAKRAIGSILTRLNKHDKGSGYLTCVKLNMVDETNELTVALSKLNEILG